MTDRSPVVPALEVLGDPRTRDQPVDYVDLGITPEEVPHLIDVLTAMEYTDLDPQNPRVWAPLHAWRALAQLGAVEAVQPYLETLDQLEDDDWIASEASRVMVQIGPRSIPALTAFVQDRHRTLHARNVVVEVLEAMAKKYLEARQPVRRALIHVLESYPENDESLNGFAIDTLRELRAREALPLMGAAFAADRVDRFIVRWDLVVDAFRLPPGTTPEEVARQT